MATITTIAAGDQITNSRTDINTNFANLNSDKVETSAIDTDTSLAANSDAKIPSQKAVKAYVDAGGNVNASTTTKGIVEEATQAEVDAGTAAGGTGARLFVNPSTVPHTRFATTSVFSGSAPTSYTDLDLSSVVGVAQKMVYLKIVNSGGSTSYRFRMNGDTSTGGSQGDATNADTVSATAYVVVKTDTSGVIEWIAGGANTTAITVEAYW